MACGRTEYLNDPEAPKPNSLVPAAGVLAVDPDGRVLLQRRRDTGQWAIPMGKQEIGETATQCAERETREETGVTVKATGLPVLGGRRRGSGIDSNVSYLAK
jgi:8-oxo-dGTP pyrophosphatase MutT (NUDIX family)